MKSGLIKELELAQGRAQYDEHAKRLLANCYILAWILKSTIKEFKDLSIVQIATQCIQGSIEIASVPVFPGQTNQPERIFGDNTEDKVPYEGCITYDLRFHAVLPGSSGQEFKLLVNLEAQKEFSPGYPLITRGIFYGARMISAQLDTEFEIPHYEDLKKVYSIWICMNVPRAVGNAVSECYIKKRDIFRSIPMRKGDYDKLSIVMIGLNDREESEGIFRLLNTLLSCRLTAEEKGKILHEEYAIPMEKAEFGKEVSHMCNLSEWVEEIGIQKGIIKGALLTVINAARKKAGKNISVEACADMLEADVSLISRIYAAFQAHPDWDDSLIYEAVKE